MDIVTQKRRKNLIQLNKTGTIGEKEYARQHEQFGIVTPNLLNRLRNDTEMKENRNLFNDLGQDKREELKAKEKQLQKEMKQTEKTKRALEESNRVLAETAIRDKVNAVGKQMLKKKNNTKRKNSNDKKVDNKETEATRAPHVNGDASFLNAYDPSVDDTDCLAILKHKMNRKEPWVLLDMEEDSDNDTAEQKQIEDDGGTWTKANNAVSDCPVMLAKYLMEHRLTGDRPWKQVWDRIITKLKRAKMSNTKQAKMQAPRIIYVKTQKSCQLCKDKFVSSNFAPEMNASYFGPSGDMAGEECNVCKVEPTDEGTKKLTNSKPWFCCSGREKHGCKTCYCNSCYQDKLLENDDGNKRTSRKRGTTS